MLGKWQRAAAIFCFITTTNQVKCLHPEWTLMMVVKVVVKSTELNARDGDSVGR